MQRATLPWGVLRAARGRIDLRLVWPSVAVAANAIAFFVLRPGVNDLWAARARASAVAHGVGLTYWFSWFGGGSTPGNYSLAAPFVCAVIGTELVGALSAVGVTVLATVAVRGLTRPVVASWVAAICVALNLWSGRVPFLLGCVVAIGAVMALRRGQRALTVALTLLTVAVTPVCAAFLLLGLSGTFLTTRTRAYRPIIAFAAVPAGLGLIAVAAIFGAPGPEPFVLALAAGSVAASLIMIGLLPPDHLRVTLWVTAIAVLVVLVVPNGMGQNIGRFVWFCLPVAVAATSPVRLRWIVFALVGAIGIGATSTFIDLTNASQPVATAAYYRPLAHRLDALPGLRDHRLEVVNRGAHAGYDALLGHAMLARGWETQEDGVLNGVLETAPLSAATYKVWLDNNAVGYVALPTGPADTDVGTESAYPEFKLVRQHAPGYLQPIWKTGDWELFRVAHATPIVQRPATVLAHSQSSMMVRVPCACTTALRLRWSKFLTANLQQPARTGRGTVDAVPAIQGAVTDDHYGWSRLRTTRPGTYVLRGSFTGITGLLH